MYDFNYLETVVSDMILEEHMYKNKELIGLVTKTLALKGYSDSMIKKVILGVYLMDIGLHLGTENDEYEDHPINGLAYLNISRDLDIVKNVVLLHHENYIGTGFPYALSGDDIPEYVQIVSVCIQYLSNMQDKSMTYEENLRQLYIYNNKVVVELICLSILK